MTAEQGRVQEVMQKRVAFLEDDIKNLIRLYNFYRKEYGMEAESKRNFIAGLEEGIRMFRRYAIAEIKLNTENGLYYYNGEAIS